MKLKKTILLASKFLVLSLYFSRIENAPVPDELTQGESKSDVLQNRVAPIPFGDTPSQITENSSSAVGPAKLYVASMTRNPIPNAKFQQVVCIDSQVLNVNQLVEKSKENGSFLTPSTVMLQDQEKNANKSPRASSSEISNDQVSPTRNQALNYISPAQDEGDEIRNQRKSKMTPHKRKTFEKASNDGISYSSELFEENDDVYTSEAKGVKLPAHHFHDSSDFRPIANMEVLKYNPLEPEEKLSTDAKEENLSYVQNYLKHRVPQSDVHSKTNYQLYSELESKDEGEDEAYSNKSRKEGNERGKRSSSTDGSDVRAYRNSDDEYNMNESLQKFSNEGNQSKKEDVETLDPEKESPEIRNPEVSPTETPEKQESTDIIEDEVVDEDEEEAFNSDDASDSSEWDNEDEDEVLDEDDEFVDEEDEEEDALHEVPQNPEESLVDTPEKQESTDIIEDEVVDEDEEEEEEALHEVPQNPEESLVDTPEKQESTDMLEDEVVDEDEEEGDALHEVPQNPEESLVDTPEKQESTVIIEDKILDEEDEDGDALREVPKNPEESLVDTPEKQESTDIIEDEVVDEDEEKASNSDNASDSSESDNEDEDEVVDEEDEEGDALHEVPKNPEESLVDTPEKQKSTVKMEDEVVHEDNEEGDALHEVPQNPEESLVDTPEKQGSIGVNENKSGHKTEIRDSNEHEKKEDSDNQVDEEEHKVEHLPSSSPPGLINSSSSLPAIVSPDESTKQSNSQPKVGKDGVTTSPTIPHVGDFAIQHQPTAMYNFRIHPSGSSQRPFAMQHPNEAIREYNNPDAFNNPTLPLDENVVGSQTKKPSLNDQNFVAQSKIDESASPSNKQTPWGSFLPVLLLGVLMI